MVFLTYQIPRCVTQTGIVVRSILKVSLHVGKPVSFLHEQLFLKILLSLPAYSKLLVLLGHLEFVTLVMFDA